MQVFVARQPIFNRKQQVVGFELLYRDGPENIFPRGTDGTTATLKVLNSTHLNSGLKSYTQNKTALINFTQEALLDGVPNMLPPKEAIIEILESVEPNDQVFEVCQALFKQGYRLALDDFIYTPEWQRFLPLVKLIKIDIELVSPDKMLEFVKVVKNHKVANISKIKLLAERIETQEDYERTKEMGFDYFQGFFFAKPTMVESKDVSPQDALLLAIYQEVMHADININKLESLFRKDPSLTYKLLKYLNSGAFSISHEINSIKAALVYLGGEKMRRFISMMVTAQLKGDKPIHLIETAIFRARFCELLAEKCAKRLKDEAFFVGLLSTLDALLDRPMAQIIAQISVSSSIAEALTFVDEKASPEGSALKNMLDLVKVHETGSWRGMQRSCAKLRLDEGEIPAIHANTISWVHQFMDQSGTIKPSKATM